MFNSRHAEALSTFEAYDPDYNDFRNKLSVFNTKQKEQSSSASEKFKWIDKERQLKKAEEAVLKQLSNGKNALLAELESDKSPVNVRRDVVTIQKKLDIRIRSNRSIQTVMDLSEALKSVAKHPDSQQTNGFIAQMILDTKDALLAMNEDMDARCSILESETSASRREALTMLIEDCNDDCIGSLLPQRVAWAIANARALEGKIAQLSETDMECHVDFLEHELRQELLILTRLKQPMKSKIQTKGDEYKRKMKIFEENALKVIGNRIKDLENAHISIVSQNQNRRKSQELSLRIQRQRMEHKKNIETKHLKHIKQDNAKNARELRLLEANMISKQALRNNNVANVQDSTSLAAELQLEVIRLSKHQLNKERTQNRETQRRHKLKSKENEQMMSARAEEQRLYRLRALAASVPYYKTIINTVSDIQKTTEARKNDVYTSRDKSLADFQSGQLKSFTNDKVFSDSKFRLANALHEAGLAQSAYAKNIVRNAIPRQEERTTGIKPY